MAPGGSGWLGVRIALAVTLTVSLATALAVQAVFAVGHSVDVVVWGLAGCVYIALCSVLFKAWPARAAWGFLLYSSGTVIYTLLLYMQRLQVTAVPGYPTASLERGLAGSVVGGVALASLVSGMRAVAGSRRPAGQAVLWLVPDAGTGREADR